MHFDVRAVHPKQIFNDYFDCDFYYDGLKISVKSSFHRVNPRPAVVLTGINGQFIKHQPDRQELDLKLFRHPHETGFGQDRPEDYGIVRTVQADQSILEEKIPTINGDYACVYDGIYEHIVLGKTQRVQAQQTLEVMRLLEYGAQQFQNLKNSS